MPGAVELGRAPQSQASMASGHPMVPAPQPRAVAAGRHGGWPVFEDESGSVHLRVWDRPGEHPAGREAAAGIHEALLPPGPGTRSAPLSPAGLCVSLLSLQPLLDSLPGPATLCPEDSGAWPGPWRPHPHCQSQPCWCPLPVGGSTTPAPTAPSEINSLCREEPDPTVLEHGVTVGGQGHQEQPRFQAQSGAGRECGQG